MTAEFATPLRRNRGFMLLWITQVLDRRYPDHGRSPTRITLAQLAVVAFIEGAMFVGLDLGDVHRVARAPAPGHG